MVDLRPFNLEHAKAGAPVITSRGISVRIICFNRKNEWPIVALLNNGVEEYILECPINGNRNNEYSLYMAPLGYCCGLPVFTGDTLISLRGVTYKVTPTHREFSYGTWPKKKVTKEVWQPKYDIDSTYKRPFIGSSVYDSAEQCRQAGKATKHFIEPVFVGTYEVDE